MPDSRAAFAVAPERPDGEILNIGQQCSAVEQKCTVVDYLPYVCDHCSKRFCHDHRLPESHACEKWDANAADRRALECPLCSELIAIPPGEDPNVRIGRHVDNDCVVMTGKVTKKSTTPTCARARCGKPLWQPISCEKCHKQFCAPHRYPSEHQCSSISTPAPTPKNQSNALGNFTSQTSARSAAAMAALKRSFASTNPGDSSPTSSPATQRAQSAPVVVVSSSASSGASAGSSKPKVPFSSKDRPEYPSVHVQPISPVAGAATDLASAITNTSSTAPNPTGRCAPTFSFANPDAFVPRPLFGRA